MSEDKCVYCGSAFELHREHVIPAHWWNSTSFDAQEQWIVCGCRQCNSIAGAFVAFSIPEKAAFILKGYKTRFAKLLRAPFWTDEELSGVSYKLRVQIEGSLVAKQVLLRRLEHLSTVSEYPPDYLRPKWLEARMQQLADEHKRLVRSLRRKRRSSATLTAPGSTRATGGSLPKESDGENSQQAGVTPQDNHINSTHHATGKGWEVPKAGTTHPEQSGMVGE